jgi:adenine-specific DNA glycosylase
MCGARAAGSQDEVPPPKPGAAVKRVVHHALVQIRDGRVALERRTEGLWSGLLAPPSVETLRALSCRQVQALSGASTVARAIARFDFQTTHRRVHFIVHPASFPEDRPLQWVPLRRLGSVAIASAGLRVVEAARGQGAPRAARLRA